MKYRCTQCGEIYEGKLLKCPHCGKRMRYKDDEIKVIHDDANIIEDLDELKEKKTHTGKVTLNVLELIMVALSLGFILMFLFVPFFVDHNIYLINFVSTLPDVIAIIPHIPSDWFLIISIIIPVSFVIELIAILISAIKGFIEALGGLIKKDAPNTYSKHYISDSASCLSVMISITVTVAVVIFLNNSGVLATSVAFQGVYFFLVLPLFGIMILYFVLSIIKRAVAKSIKL